MECASSEDSDQPGLLPILIRAFAVGMKKHWVLSYPLSALRILWSDRADAQTDLSIRWAHMPFCWICHEATQLWNVQLNAVISIEKVKQNCSEGFGDFKIIINFWQATVDSRDHLSQLMGLWYLSHSRPAKAQASLRIRAVSPESSLFAHIKYANKERVRQKIRHLAQLDGCACAFEEWVYGGRKVHNLMRWLSFLVQMLWNNKRILRKHTIKLWSTYF